MSKYIKSAEGFPSQLHLWDPQPTQGVIEETKWVDVYPTNSLEYSDEISFTIPSMERYMLENVEIFTELRVLTESKDKPPAKQNVSTSPHLAASLWRNVEVYAGGVSLTQSYDNSYSMFKFWDDVIHNNHDSRPMLKCLEGLNLDSVGDKSESENLEFFPATGEPKNANGQERAKAIEEGKTVYLRSDLNIPLFKQGKLLPSEVKFQIKLTKNYSGFILLAADTNTDEVCFDKVFLRCTFQRPRDTVLSIIEERLAKENAIFHADKKAMTIYPVTDRSTTIQLENLLNGPLPYFFLVCVQDRSALGKKRSKNPFSLNLVKKAQLYVNGKEHFPRALEMTDHLETNMMAEFVKGTGSKGDSMVVHHYRVYPALAFDLTQDKTQNQHGLNLMQSGTVRLTMEMLRQPTEDLVVMVLAWYEQVIEVNKNRQFFII